MVIAAHENISFISYFNNIYEMNETESNCNILEIYI